MPRRRECLRLPIRHVAVRDGPGRGHTEVGIDLGAFERADTQVDHIAYDSRAVFDQLEAEVEAAMGRHVVPGVALGVLHEGRVETAGFGVTSAEHPLPVDADTLFLVASNTKTFTGAAVLRLVEQGKLDLDAPLRGYLPELRLADPAATAGVTLRHTLQHTAGWVGDFAPDTGRGDDA